MPARIGPKRPVRVYLAEWREWAELTQEDLGLRIEPAVDKGTVSRWENAKPGHLTLGVIAAFAEAVQRPVADMYRLPPAKNKPSLPSLDALAGQMGEGIHEATLDFLAATAKARASRR